MATYLPTARKQNPYLPFGDQRNAPFYGKDILSVKQFNRDDLVEMRQVLIAKRRYP